MITLFDLSDADRKAVLASAAAGLNYSFFHIKCLRGTATTYEIASQCAEGLYDVYAYDYTLKKLVLVASHL